MTWIPCGQCLNSPCTCDWTAQPQGWRQHVYPAPGWTGQWSPTFQLPQKLSDEDIDRIAKRVLERIDERIAAARTGWARRFRERVKWMEWLLRRSPDDDEPTPGGARVDVQA